MQRLCGVDEPCYGAIFACEVHHGQAKLAASDYCHLGVETEIAFRLGHDLPRELWPSMLDEIAALADRPAAARGLRSYSRRLGGPSR